MTTAEQMFVTRIARKPMPQKQPWPISDLNEILRSCNPGKPLLEGDTRREDFKDLRRSSIKPLQTRLSRTLDEGEFHHLLLCGHRGSGKSTELLRLQAWADDKGFLAVMSEADAWLGNQTVDYADLFLLAAVLVEKAMQEFGHPLPQDKILKVVRWFNETIIEDTEDRKSELGAEVGAQLETPSLPFSIGKLFAKLTASFRASSVHSVKTRETLKRYPNELIDFSNDLLTTANQILRANGKERGLLIVFDNLDRYDCVNIDELLVRGCHLVRRMACHAVFTFPIALAYRPITERIPAEYGKVVTLPMLSLRQKGERWGTNIANTAFLDASIVRLRDALAKRIVIKDLFESPDDADYLVKMSGGAIRDLIQLVELASNYAEESDTLLTHTAVQQAIDDLRSTYMRILTVKPHYYRCLAAIAERAGNETMPDDFGDAINDLLFTGCLLEYMGDGLPWLDVHPVLIETNEFQNARDAYRKNHP